VKALFLTPAFPPFPGGGERYAQSLALQLVQRECAVTVVTSTAHGERDFWQPAAPARRRRAEHEMGLHIVRCPLRPMPGGRAGLLMWRKAMVLMSALPGDQSTVLMKMARLIPPIFDLNAALARFPDRVDVIHAFNLSWEYPMLEAWRLAQHTSTPLVLTPFAHLGAGKHDRVARNSTMDHQLRMLREADAVLTLTEIERQGLSERGVPHERMITVGSGLDDTPVLLDEDDVLTRYHLPRPLIVFIGRASYDKGALHAAEAVLRLRRQGLAATLALIGPSTPEMARFLRELRISDREAIRPLGVVPEAEKHTLLQASALLLLPSRTDSFGIVILEAWAHGKPVIGSRAGGIPAVIDEGRNGLLVDFGDMAGLTQAIQHLLNDETLRRTLGQHGRAKLTTHYTWARVADQVLAVYQQVQ
jgi:glycosyltransferase involved in cell wall biosynthesis